MIKTLIQTTAFFLLLGAIVWFVLFETNPYAVCIDHPNPKYSATYYQCKPFNRVIKKPAKEKKFRDGKY